MYHTSPDNSRWRVGLACGGWRSDGETFRGAAKGAWGRHLGYPFDLGFALTTGRTCSITAVSQRNCASAPRNANNWGAPCCGTNATRWPWSGSHPGRQDR